MFDLDAMPEEAQVGGSGWVGHCGTQPAHPVARCMCTLHGQACCRVAGSACSEPSPPPLPPQVAYSERWGAVERLQLQGADLGRQGISRICGLLADIHLKPARGKRSELEEALLLFKELAGGYGRSAGPAFFDGVLQPYVQAGGWGCLWEGARVQRREPAQPVQAVVCSARRASLRLLCSAQCCMPLPAHLLKLAPCSCTWR